MYRCRFGGGPACNHLYECPTCEQAAEALHKRITIEMDTFKQLNHDFQVICTIVLDLDTPILSEKAELTSSRSLSSAYSSKTGVTIYKIVF